MSDARSEDKPSKRPEGGEEASRPRKPAKYSRPTVPMVEDFGEATQRGNTDAGIKDLVQFFRRTPPPPTNFMSIPDNFSGTSEEDRWDKFKTKVFRRPSKKLRKKRPPFIVLPDSAVAARSTDGHRYIAISIPSEHSPLEPRPTSQHPIFGSVEAALHRDAGSRFGTWKISPANRLVTVLNPVPEELRESLSSSSPISTTREQSEPATALSAPSTRKRAHTVSLSPTQEQRYTPKKAKDSTRSRSISDPHTASSIIPESSEGRRAFTSATAEETEPGPSRQDVPVEIVPKDISAPESSTPHLPGNPKIMLTLPSRKSSRRGKQLEPVSPDTFEKATSPRQGSSSSAGTVENEGSGHQRSSFAASIETTASSPQLLKATTAIVGQSIPIVVRPVSADTTSPLDLNFPEQSSGKGKGNREFRTSAVGPPPPMLAAPERPQSKKERAKHRDPEKQRAQAEHKGKGKGKEPASHPREGEDDGSTSPSVYSLPSKSSASAHDQGRAPSPISQREQREEREARYIAKVLASERETLENLPRAELIQRYEALREQRIYERERRLRKLERSQDTWASAVPMLLQDLNGLLRQQHRILEGAGLASSSHHHHNPLRYTRRRSRSVEVSSSSSPLSETDPLETQRSRSLHIGGESHQAHRSSKAKP